MAVLVTGGAGYIGSHVVLGLLDAGEDVVVVDRLSNSEASSVHPAAELAVADAGDTDTMLALMERRRVDSVMHLAGSIVVPDSVVDPLGYYLNNTCVSRSLIDVAVRHGVEAFVFSSTAAVYGAAGDVPLREDGPLSPQSPYGTSKLAVEWMLRDVDAAHGMRHAALRYFNVCGADPRGRAGQCGRGATHVMKVACEVAAGKRPYMDVYGVDYGTPDGTCVRDYVHVSDLAAAHLAALSHLRSGGTSVTANCSYGRGRSVREVVAAVAAAAGRDVPYRDAARRPGDPAVLVADPTRAAEVLGWKPEPRSLEEMATHALAWERRLGSRPA